MMNSGKGSQILLWNPNHQAGIRSQIYLDRHTPNSGESYVDHYIRYANLASSLDPPMTDMDLLSALTSHYEPREILSARKMFGLFVKSTRVK